DLVGRARLDDGRLIIDLGIRLDVQIAFDGHIEVRQSGKRIARYVSIHVKASLAIEGQILPYNVGEEGKWAFSRFEIAHQGHERVALLHDLKEVLVDIDGMAAGGDVAVDARHPTIRRKAELPLARWCNRLDQLGLGTG